MGVYGMLVDAVFSMMAISIYRIDSIQQLIITLQRPLIMEDVWIALHRTNTKTGL